MIDGFTFGIIKCAHAVFLLTLLDASKIVVYRVTDKLDVRPEDHVNMVAGGNKGPQ
ncbi:hypothetical protein D3C75_1271480 [compost metagenome]